ncbi:U1 zinc finger-domain-containing protein [Aspergillus oleicola]
MRVRKFPPNIEGGRPKHILVVEDNQINLLASKIIARFNCVASISNGPDALAYLADQRNPHPHLIFISDYCDVYLTHDSMSVRKAHNSGRNHLRNVVEYYQLHPGLHLIVIAEIGQEKAQSVIDSITNSYAAEGQAVPNPAMAPPGAFPPPFAFGQFPPPPFGMPPPGPGGAPAMPPRTSPSIPLIPSIQQLKIPN